ADLEVELRQILTARESTSNVRSEGNGASQQTAKRDDTVQGLSGSLKMGDTGIKAVNPTRHGWGFFFRQNKLRIRTRLTASFLIIVLSMIVADALVFWQFTQMVAPSRRLSNVDQV